MAQASVLTDTEIKRVFRIIETTRHAARNRLAFVLSIYAGLRVGEISALTVRDVATNDGGVRREIKLGAHQTKGSKGSHPLPKLCPCWLRIETRRHPTRSSS